MADDNGEQQDRGENGPEEGAPPPNPSQPEAPDGDPPPPRPSPWTTETVQWATGVDDEVLAVVLRGAPVGKTRIGLDLAGPFLFRLNELVHAIASAVAGRRAGRRGTLPDVPGAGLLALADVQWGASATFHFGLGAGEELRMGYDSITEEAVRTLTAMLTSTAGEADRELFGITRDLGQRVGVNYVSLINVLDHHGVDSVWRTTAVERAIDLSVPRVRRAKVVLDQEEPPRTLHEHVVGLLYRADSKEHQFVLEPIEREEDKIVGTYAQTLREEIRDAWDKVVEVEIRTTHHFLARQVEPAHVDVELLEVIRIVEP